MKMCVTSWAIYHCLLGALTEIEWGKLCFTYKLAANDKMAN